MKQHKKGVLTNSIFEMTNDDYELNIKEWENAIHRYLKTGIKSKQLDDLIDREDMFQQGYSKCFDSEKIVQIMINDSKKELLEDNQQFELSFIDNADVNNNMQMELRIKTEEMLEKIERILENELAGIIKDVAYLSHVNMLYELYEKESKLRQEEKEYKEALKQYKSMDKIVKPLRTLRRMGIKELQESVALPEQTVYATIFENKEYFNVKGKGNTYQVSLSPKGRRIAIHVKSSIESYSGEALEQLIYKNCYNVMDGLEKNFNNRNIRMEIKAKFEGISPEKERALQSKYDQITRRVYEKNNDTLIYDYFELEEGGKSYNEKNKYKLKISRSREYNATF